MQPIINYRVIDPKTGQSVIADGSSVDDIAKALQFLSEHEIAQYDRQIFSRTANILLYLANTQMQLAKSIPDYVNGGRKDYDRGWNDCVNYMRDLFSDLGLNAEEGESDD